MLHFILLLLKERRSWPKQLDTLEQGIKQQNDELSELKVMYDDAQIARDTARAELSKLEQSVYEAKREREVQLAEYKKQAEEKKEHAEKVEKRVNRKMIIIFPLFYVLFQKHRTKGGFPLVWNRNGNGKKVYLSSQGKNLLSTIVIAINAQDKPPNFLYIQYPIYCTK